MDVIAAIQFAGTKAWPVLRVTARMVGISLLRAAPYLAIAGIVYLVLLREFDINYYMQEKPPVFLVALGIAGVLAAALAVVLLRLFAGWLFRAAVGVVRKRPSFRRAASQFAAGTLPSPPAPAVDRRLGLGILGVICRGDIHRVRSRPFLGTSSRRAPSDCWRSPSASLWSSGPARTWR